MGDRVKFLFFFLLGCIAGLLAVGYVVHKAGLKDYVIDSVFGHEESIVSEDFCLNHGHTIENRTMDGTTIEACKFEHGGWCEIGDFYDGSCGDV